MDWNPLVIVIVGAIGTLLGSLTTAFIPKKGSAENALIDQQQEEITRLDKIILEKEAEIVKVRRRERILSDYAEALRMQISKEEGPPPLAWPNFGDSE